MADVGSARVAPVHLKFSNLGARLDWIDKFERWCENLPAGTLRDVPQRLLELRELVRHEGSYNYAPGAPLETLRDRLRSLGDGTFAAKPTATCFDGDACADTISDFYVGSNAMQILQKSLLKIRGVARDLKGMALRQPEILPGSNLIVRAPPNTSIFGIPLHFLICVAMDSPSRYSDSNKCLVAWFLPPWSKAGSKADIFGSWRPFAEVDSKTARQAQLPDPEVGAGDVLDFNFEWTGQRGLPYDMLDVLRLKHGIDMAGLNMSRTPRCNLYRSYALARPGL